MTRIKHIITLVMIILFSACATEEDQNSSIPDRRVEIDINITLEHQFVSSYHTKEYPNSGYAGVLVASDIQTNIYAYDLCCPYEAPIINKIKSINDLQAQCPKCKSTYEIADGTGRVASGPSTKRLKSYRVYKEGSWYRIRN